VENRIWKQGAQWKGHNGSLKKKAVRPICEGEPEFYFLQCVLKTSYIASRASLARHIPSVLDFQKIATPADGLKGSIAGECAQARHRQPGSFSLAKPLL
jgi:hypothetical protein